MGVPLKVATPGKRPKAHRATERRDNARDAFEAELAKLELPAWARVRLTSPPFSSSARADDYEALTVALRADRGGA